MSSVTRVMISVEPGDDCWGRALADDDERATDDGDRVGGCLERLGLCGECLDIGYDLSRGHRRLAGDEAARHREKDREGKHGACHLSSGGGSCQVSLVSKALGSRCCNGHLHGSMGVTRGCDTQVCHW